MHITADSNVLLRVLVADDARQSRLALQAMEAATTIAVSLQSLCELTWVLDRRYEISRADIAATIRQLLDTRGVIVNRPAVAAGLAMLEAGGDFADGIIAYDGQWLGAESFVSFDRKAVRLLGRQGILARLLK